jgi:hypothetical protein
MSVGWKVITSAQTVPVTTSPKMEGLTATKNTSLFEGTLKNVCENFHFWSIAEHEKNSGTTVIEESYGHEAIPDGSNGPTDLKTTSPPTSMAYPNCDLNIWLRSCEIEVINPLEGITTGAIPLWVNGNLISIFLKSYSTIVLTKNALPLIGSLYRNGPGKQDYGRQRVNHLFDAAGLLHK